MSKAIAVLIAFFVMHLTISDSAAGQDCPMAEVRETVTPTDKRPSNRYLRQTDILKSEELEPDVVFVGDSLIERWEPYMRDQFKELRVVNLGVSGDKTQNTIWRLRHLPAIRKSPRLVAILIGTNNLGDKVSSCAIADGITTIVRMTRELWPQAKTLVFSIPPRGKNFRTYEKSRINVNILVRNYIRSIDHSEFNQIDDEIFACRKADQTGPCNNYEEDKLHISKQGYDLLSKYILDRI